MVVFRNILFVFLSFFHHVMNSASAFKLLRNLCFSCFNYSFHFKYREKSCFSLGVTFGFLEEELNTFFQLCLSLNICDRYNQTTWFCGNFIHIIIAIKLPFSRDV